MAKDRTLGVLTSNGMGLSDWERVGTLAREVAIYKRLSENGWDITFFTYDQTKHPPSTGFNAIIVPQWPFKMSSRLSRVYRILLPVIRYHHGRKCDILITNQAHSAGAAVIASRLWKSKLIARCGYVFGESAETLHRRGVRVSIRKGAEKFVFRHADHCVVPTRELAEWVTENYGVLRSKITVIPNYVDTNLFKPFPSSKKHVNVLFVGRLDKVKRLELLLESVRGTGLTVRFVGSGPLRRTLLQKAEDNEVDLVIEQRVSNEKLPDYYNSADVFVLLSEWEGHPKVLIEAMACGSACVGAKAPGIQNLLVDGETGLLVDPVPQVVQEAIMSLVENKKLRQTLGANARAYTLKYYSLDVVSDRYLSILNEVLNGQ